MSIQVVGMVVMFLGGAIVGFNARNFFAVLGIPAALFGHLMLIRPDLF